MQRLFSKLIAGVACISLLNWGCTKIDNTVLGADLIPAVDNVTTFADTLSIEAAREQMIDTTRLSRSETHVLGSINNDPVFGKVSASIFAQLKPTFFPFYIGKAGDTINPAKNAKTHFDSAFLCLSFTNFYGDSTLSQHLSVYQLDEATTNFSDTIAHLLNFVPNQPFLGNLIGEATINEQDLKNYTFLKTSAKDSITRQIRIKLSNAFLTTLVKGDSSINAPNNFFNNDSIFKSKFKGFAIVPDGSSNANGLFYISLTDAKTRLEVHYVAGNGNVLDTNFSSLTLSTGSLLTLSASANANNITRDTSNSIFPGHPDPKALYIQTTPGSAISLKIPALSSYSNRIIHRAEIFLEQVPGDALDNVLTPPQFLYLDLAADTSTATKYKPLYYDLSPNDLYNPDSRTTFFPNGGIDQNYYGGYLRYTTDAFGTRAFYTFNLTRYLQNLVTKGGTNYRFRVSAPYNLNYYGLNLTYKNNLAFGRVKIQNDPLSPYRVRMRVVYSKLLP
ncbi:MAG: DUF4270 family protein [Ferruginibacter sp.]